MALSIVSLLGLSWVPFEVYDTLLNLPTELKRVSYILKWFRRPAGSMNDHRTISEHPTQQAFLDTYALNLRQEEFKSSAAQESDFYDDPLISDGHFGCLSGQITK